MCRREDTPVVALADDLSGAAEVAALLGLPARLVLHPAELEVSLTSGEALVMDLDSRYLDDEAASHAVRAALAAVVRPAPAAGAREGTDVMGGRAFRAVNSLVEGGTPLWFKKCDSLLRGPVGAEAAAFAEGAGTLVIATALPAARRVVRDGVVLVDGVPLHESAAWRAEERAAPRSVAEALTPLPTTGVALGTVRQGPRALADRFREVAARGRHPVCDAETDTDLSVIAEAAALLGPGTRLLGSGGLAAALGRLLAPRGTDGPSARAASAEAGPAACPTVPAPVAASRPTGPVAAAGPAATRAPAGRTSPPSPESSAAPPGAGSAPRFPAGPAAARRSPARPAAVPSVPAARKAAGHPAPTSADGAVRPLLVVAGSADPVVGEQVAELVANGARHLTLDPGRLAGTAGPLPLPDLAPGSVTVLSVDGNGGVRAGAARAIVAGLARTVSALPGHPDLVLTGGETARRVLDSLGITALRPVGEIHHGAVHCQTTDGRSVVTRPGSFGGPDSFVRIAAALRPSQQGVTQ
ncbi:four-carbon acid sugar kinase family protein [Streptomyces sp. NPDC087512]|uniref:four-carbon acid sugar kinase family protein n=1 Tax=unclassified Streptomyces TaxID=2593676 RepID=UPI00341CF867